MNKSEIANCSLADIAQKIVPILNYCPSVEQFLSMVESCESNIRALEARVSDVKQELEILNSQH